MLSQIIDVSMEALLMIKRVLVDVTLKQNIFIIDCSKQIFPFMQQEIIQRGSYQEKDHNLSPNNSQMKFDQGDIA